MQSTPPPPTTPMRQTRCGSESPESDFTRLTIRVKICAALRQTRGVRTHQPSPLAPQNKKFKKERKELNCAIVCVFWKCDVLFCLEFSCACQSPDMITRPGTPATRVFPGARSHAPELTPEVTEQTLVSVRGDVRVTKRRGTFLFCFVFLERCATYPLRHNPPDSLLSVRVNPLQD